MMHEYRKIIAFLIPILSIIAFVIYNTRTFNSIGVFVLDFSIVFLVIFVFLILTKQQVFYTWSKFAIIFFPIAIVLVVVAPTINGTLIGFDKKSAALWLATIFLIASLFIIAIKSFKLRKEGK